MAARTLASPADQPRCPLILTGDPDLLDDLVRLAAASGVPAHVEPDPAGARARWASAALVLIGADMAGALARMNLPPRDDLVLVSRASEATRPWPVARELRARHVALLPAAEPWLVDRLADAGDDRRRASVIAVLGGRGGAGASVLAAGLAVTAVRRGLDTLLVDADPMGGGVDLVLGWEEKDGLRWPQLVDARGRIDPPALVDALPGQANLAVLSFDRGDLLCAPPEAMAAALDAGRRGRDVVVLDLPRRLDDAATLALACADRAFLVVPAEVRACVAAARIARVAGQHCPALSAVVRGPAPGHLHSDEVVAGLGLPLAGAMRPEPGLDRALERGEVPAGTGRGPLARMCGQLLDDAGLPGNRRARRASGPRAARGEVTRPVRG